MAERSSSSRPTRPVDARLPAEVLEELGRLDCTTVFNVLKQIGRGEEDSFSGPELRCLQPGLGTRIGYAVTSEWTSGEDDAPNEDFLACLELAESIPGPKIAVLVDVGRRPGRSGIAGDGMMREFQVLGCVGAVVGGSIMDITGIERVGMPVWATGVVPAYTPLRMAGFGRPVHVGPLAIATGDLVMADRGGAIRIPIDAAEAVLRHLPEFRRLELGIQEVLDRPGVTAAEIRAWYAANEPEFLGDEA